MIDKHLLDFLGKFRERYGELIFHTCPECGNSKWNFQVNCSKDVFHSWCCGYSGKVTTLLKSKGIQVDTTPWQSTVPVSKPNSVSVLSFDSFKPLEFSQFSDFLTSRGLEETDIKRYNLMTSDTGPYKDNVIIPLYEGSTPVYFTARNTLAKGQYQQPKDHERKKLLLYYLGTEHRFRLYIVEGPFDAIVVNKLGFSTCPLLSSGISKYQIEKIKTFGFEEVVVCLDGDIKRVAIKLYETLQKSGLNTKIVLIPGKDDPNDLYTLDKEYLQKLLEKPKKLAFNDRVQILLGNDKS